MTLIESFRCKNGLWNGIGEDQKHTVPKCLIITQRKNGLKYYYKNREKKLAYSKTYRDNHKKEKATYSKEYFENHPEKREQRRIYMKNYHKRKRASKKTCLWLKYLP